MPNHRYDQARDRERELQKAISFARSLRRGLAQALEPEKVAALLAWPEFKQAKANVNPPRKVA